MPISRSRSMKRSHLLAGAGAVLVMLLAATSAEAQTAGASATGVRTTANNQATQSNVRTDTSDTVIASLVTGAIDGAAAEISDNSAAVTARGNQAFQHLDADLATPDGHVRLRANAIMTLQWRDLLRAGGNLEGELGKSFVETCMGEPIEGRLVRRVDLASGQFALVEKSREFQCDYVQPDPTRPPAAVKQDAIFSSSRDWADSR